MLTTFKGRTLPFNDWEGDDFTPGAGGHWVTCMDTAAGRAACWATNGRVCVDGKVVRAHVVPRDTNGINFVQADQALGAIHAGLHVIHPDDWRQAKVTSWLKAGRGLIVTGIYSEIPRAYRHQASANFAHAMFVSHINAEGTGMRLYDPLNPKTHERGEWAPTSILWPFLRSRGWQVGYVPLQPL